MVRVESLTLEGPTTKAAAAAGLVWRASDGALLSHEAYSLEEQASVPTRPVSALAGSATLLAAVTEDGELTGRDPETGAVRFAHQVDPATLLAGGSSSVWLYDRGSAVARSISDDGSLGEQLAVGPVADLAVEDDRLWWSAPGGRLIGCSDGRKLDAGSYPGRRSGLVVCARSVWLGGQSVLLRIGTWAGEVGLPLETGVGLPVVMTCAGGRVVGADETTAFVLDPAVDANVVRLAAQLTGRPLAAVGHRNVAWIITTAKEAIVARF